MRLQDKVAIVTGGGAGIGRATSIRFATEGARVAVVDMNLDAAEETVAQVGKAGGDARAFRADVADKGQVEAVVGEVKNVLGGLHILINNAGVTRDASAKKLNEDDWDMVLRVNLKGTFLTCQAVIPTLTEQSWGRIVNTASIAVRGNFGQSNYAASKAGVIGLTRTLALEVARFGVTVNCIAPGATDTAMVAAIPDEYRTKLIKRIPLQRIASPDEIAAVHAFLASDDAAYVTGQCLFADGGASIGH